MPNENPASENESSSQSKVENGNASAVQPSKDNSNQSNINDAESLKVSEAVKDITGDLEQINEVGIGSGGGKNDLLHELKGEVDSKMNSLMECINKLNESTIANTKNQKLEWAIVNVGLSRCFTYYEKGSKGRNSQELVKNVLFIFRKGVRVDISNYSMYEYLKDGKGEDFKWTHDGGKPIEDGEREFRRRLSEQMYQLTGVKPRVVCDGGKYAICYS